MKLIKKYSNISKSTIYRWISKNNNGSLYESYKKESKYTPPIKAYIRDYVSKKIHFEMKALIKSVFES